MNAKLKIASLIVASASVLSTQAFAGDNYFSVHSGYTECLDTSNDDELECGNEKSFSLGGAIGHEFEYVRLEIEGRYDYRPLHGQNGDHIRLNGNGVHKMSADGETLHIGTLFLNAWPQVEIYDGVKLYAGGGIGPSIMTALSDTALTMSAQVGAGVTYDVTDAVVLDLGYRYHVTLPCDIDGNRSTYDAHGPSLRVTFKW